MQLNSQTMGFCVCVGLVQHSILVEVVGTLAEEGNPVVEEDNPVAVERTPVAENMPVSLHIVHRWSLIVLVVALSRVVLSASFESCIWTVLVVLRLSE